MTGYRRVLTCGEPCAEDFDCPSCITNGLSGFCGGSAYNAVCPSTVVATITTPEVARFTPCLDSPDVECNPFTVPAVSTTVTLSESSAGSCTFDGTIDVVGAWGYTKKTGGSCDIDTVISWDGMRVIVYIQHAWVVLFAGCSDIIAPCGDGPDSTTPTYCKGFVIGCIIQGYDSGSATTYYTFADAYKASDVGSCTGASTLCWNEMSAMKNFSSNVFCLEDDTWWSTECCDAGSYYARSASGTSPSCASYADTMSISIA